MQTAIYVDRVDRLASESEPGADEAKFASLLEGAARASDVAADEASCAGDHSP